MALYEKNLEFFKENLKVIYDIVTLGESRYKSNIEIIDESLNLVVENEGKRCFIHSNYDIKRENLKMFSSIESNVEKLVVFGLGLGFCAEYIYENFKNLRNLTIIEPDLNVFKVAMNYLDMAELINKIGNVTFIINRTKEEACQILWSNFNEVLTEKMNLTYNLSYRSLYNEYYEYLSSTLTSYIKSYLINMSTEEHFLYKWTENSIKNSKHEAIGLANFKNKFTDLPVILVSAGPSLNYNMKYLKEVRDKALIIALGSAIKILDTNGIVPHFRLAFDGSEAERNIFRDIDTEACKLVFSDLLNYHIVDEYRGNKLRMVLDTDYISQYIQKKLYNNNFTFQSGFSVANVALDVAINLGFKKIIFIGQDLCYTEGSVHAKGTWRKEDNNIDFQSSRFIETVNTLGDKVYTDKQFLGMKDLLEQRIKLNPEICYINATERGLNIEGTLNKSFDKLIEEDLSKIFNIEVLLNEMINKNESKYGVDIDKLKSKLLIELENLIFINNDRFNRLKKLKKYYEKNLGVNKLKSEIKYIQDMEESLEDIEFYRESIKPMMFNKFKTIYMNYYYNGDDDKIIIEKNLKALFGQTVELKRYLEFLLSLIKE